MKSCQELAQLDLLYIQINAALLNQRQFTWDVLGRGIIRPQQGKLEAIQHAKQPTTKKQVRSFLGLVGCYRRFIPQFSDKALALMDLTKKDKPNKVIWTADCENAFVVLKEALCKEPVLQSPRFDQQFTVQTDASEYGLGAVLLQGQPNQLHPVAYISRKLLPRETRYSVIEKECLAVYARQEVHLTD